MLWVFYHSEKEREIRLAEALAAGMPSSAGRVELRPRGACPDMSGIDLAAFVGIKSAKLMRAARDQGVRTMTFDKGYSRHRGPNRTWEYWRASLDAHQPTETTLMRKSYPRDRYCEMGWSMRPWRRKGRKIIIAGSSAKYHEAMGLDNPNTYARGLIKQIRQRSRRPIVYRPKPSWKGAKPLKKAEFSDHREHIGSVLREAHCLITYGSNACFDAIAAGVPAIVLGDAVARPICSTSIDDIEQPMMVRDGDRIQWAANLAYHQWTEAEMAAGDSWPTMEGWLDEN